MDKDKHTCDPPDYAFLPFFSLAPCHNSSLFSSRRRSTPFGLTNSANGAGRREVVNLYSASGTRNREVRDLFVAQYTAALFWVTRFIARTLFLSDFASVTRSVHTFASVHVLYMAAHSTRSSLSSTTVQVDRLGCIGAIGVRTSALALRLSQLLDNPEVDFCNAELLGLALAFSRRVRREGRRFADLESDSVANAGFLPGPQYRVQVAAPLLPGPQYRVQIAAPLLPGPQYRVQVAAPLAAAPEAAQDDVPTPPSKKRPRVSVGTPAYSGASCSLQVIPSSSSDKGTK